MAVRERSPTKRRGACLFNANERRPADGGYSFPCTGLTAAIPSAPLGRLVLPPVLVDRQDVGDRHFRPKHDLVELLFDFRDVVFMLARVQHRDYLQGGADLRVHEPPVFRLGNELAEPLYLCSAGGVPVIIERFPVFQGPGQHDLVARHRMQDAL